MRIAAGVCCFLTGFVRACRFSAGRCGGEPRSVDVRGVSCLAVVVASHAVLTWRAGEGGGLILPALAKSAPTLPSPPRHHGTARCAACGGADRNAAAISSLVASFARLLPFSACPRIPVQAHTGSHGQGVSRSDNLCSQCAEDGSPLERARSEVTPPQPGQPDSRPTAARQIDRQIADQAVMSDASPPPWSK